MKMCLTGFAGMLAAPGPFSCSQQPNSVLYSGVWFAALDGTAPSTYSSGCQYSYVQLPSGWVVADDNSVSRSAIAAYRWGTDVMVVANGYAYGTSNYYTGRLYSTSQLYSDGAGGYRPANCNLRILIQCWKSGKCISILLLFLSNEVCSV